MRAKEVRDEGHQLGQKSEHLFLGPWRRAVWTLEEFILPKAVVWTASGQALASQYSKAIYLQQFVFALDLEVSSAKSCPMRLGTAVVCAVG
jgi:hypothetical protein